MSTVKCPDCGRPVSSDVEGPCPHCGCPRSKLFGSSSSKSILSLVLVVIVCIAGYFGSRDDDKTKQNETDTIQKEQMHQDESLATDQNMNSSYSRDIIVDEVGSKKEDVNYLFESNNEDESSMVESPNNLENGEEQILTNNFETDITTAVKETKESKKERKKLEKEKKKLEKERKKTEKEKLKQEKKRKDANTQI